MPCLRIDSLPAQRTRRRSHDACVLVRKRLPVLETRRADGMTTRVLCEARKLLGWLQAYRAGVLAVGGACECHVLAV